MLEILVYKIRKNQKKNKQNNNYLTTSIVFEYLVPQRPGRLLRIYIKAMNTKLLWN